MFDSLKAWANIPVIIKPCIGRSATGDKLFGTPYASTCYPVGEVTVVRNLQGAEVVSNTKLYLDGALAISELDCVILAGIEYSIQTITSYFANGQVSLKVVYL